MTDDSHEGQKRPIVDAGDPDRVVIERVVAYYAATLRESPEALAYLQKRGLSHPELLDTFMLGFSDRTLGLRIPKVNRRAGWALRTQLQRLGILRSSGHEHFRGAITVPIHDADGRIVTVYGRLTTRSPKAGAQPHLFAPERPRGVFNWQALAAAHDVIVTRSIFDALTFWCHDLRNVTASWGLDGFGDEHLDAFIDHGVERVLVAYPRTEAGDAAAAKLAEVLAARGMQVFRVVLPQGCDVNDYAVSDVVHERDLATLVRNATWLAGTRAQPVPAALTTPTPSTVPADTPPPAPPFLAPPFAPDVHAEEREHEVVMQFGDRRWRIRGLEKNTSFERMKVNILVSRDVGDTGTAGFHVDTLELYSARQRSVFIRDAALEVGHEERVLKADLARLLLELERLQEEHICRTLEPKRREVVLTDAERDAALALLRDPNLVDRILDDYERCGLVGEKDGKLVAHIAAVSRKLDEPLALVVQSASSAGKSALMESVLAFVPEEERVSYSAMTGQSLYYMGEHDLAHKVLAVTEQQGAEEASYALKLLQSEGELTIASTGKDPQTGRLMTQEYRVVGPVMLFLTTTSPELDEELLNRCLVLTVDEGQEQTRAIHDRQRQAQTLEGLLAREESARIVRLHQNAQRLLKPLAVVNPHAPRLSFAVGRTRTRRDHQKYLTLIRAIALLHQHQRPVRTIEHEGAEVRYIEVEEGDIALADRLFAVLRQGLDELPPQTAKLLGLVEQLVRERAEREGLDPGDIRFTRREVREYTGWGHTQVRVHLGRLEELEYVVRRSVGSSGRRLLYTYDGSLAGSGADLAGGWRGIGGGAPRASIPSDRGHIPEPGGASGGSTSRDATSVPPTYVQPPPRES